jgi:hypothetical protein
MGEGLEAVLKSACLQTHVFLKADRIVCTKPRLNLTWEFTPNSAHGPYAKLVVVTQDPLWNAIRPPHEVA